MVGVYKDIHREGAKTAKEKNCKQSAECGTRRIRKGGNKEEATNHGILLDSSLPHRVTLRHDIRRSPAWSAFPGVAWASGWAIAGPNPIERRIHRTSMCYTVNTPAADEREPARRRRSSIWSRR
jgi:hypothetical protein